MTEYRATSHVPPLVEQAVAAAAAAGFANSCSTETGRLLHLLAVGLQRGPAAEIGTGCGVGAAWIATALASGIPFFTVERDGARAAIARRLLAPLPEVRVIEGDWQELLRHGPFTLLFADVKAAKNEAAEAVLQALAPRGIAILDDLTPEELWPPEWRGRPDPVRQFWLNDPRLAATEVRVTAESSVLLATRLS